MSYKVIIDPHRFLEPVQKILNEKHKVDFIKLGEFINKYKSTDKEAEKKINNINLSPQFLEQFPCWFKNDISSIKEIFLKTIEEHFNTHSPTIKAMDYGLQKEGISLILLWNDVTPWTKALTFLGKKYGIPCLHVNHGIPCPIAVHKKIWADKIAVFGESSKKMYLNYGNSEEKIVITGNPFWDNWGDCEKENTIKYRKDLKVPEDKKIIVYFPTWYHNFAYSKGNHDDEKNDLNIMISALKNSEIINKIHIIIKLHPGVEEHRYIYEEALKTSGLSYTITTSRNALLFLQIADLAIVMSPSMIVESMLVKRPVIFYSNYSNLTRSAIDYHLSPHIITDNSPFYIAINQEDLFNSINRVINGFKDFSQKDIRKFLQWLNGPCDGQAARRVAELALNMIKGSKPLGFISPVAYQKSTSYYTGMNQHIVDMIDKKPVKILEIGCSSGIMGEYIKKLYPRCEYTGLEINSEAAGIAKTKIDRVIMADVEKTNLSDCGIEEKSFDFIIYGDVLEHLYDPWTVLHKHKKYLKPDGHVIASIPNIRNIHIIKALINGDWTYTFEGIMDSTHIRFFTLREIKNWFKNCGYEITDITNSCDNSFNLKTFPDNASVDLDKFIIKNVSREEAKELSTVQFIIKAKRKDFTEMEDRVKKYKVSIVIVTYNSSQTLQQCIDSVLESTKIPFEVLAVDNDSKDNTKDILENYGTKIKTIYNKENLGFSRACNQGIENSEGDYIVLLNPDTVVTENWAERMISHFKPDTGAVGPLSDYVAGLQKAEFYLPKNSNRTFSLKEISTVLYENNRLKSVETKLLIGFCIMFSRKILDKVGYLDEELFLGNDDLDISWRLREKGYNLLVATDTFIHHKGQVSFKTEKKTKTDWLVQESTDILYKKLENYYGKGNIPSPMELWGINWFNPSKELMEKGHAKFIPGLTSIIILTLNQLEHTEKCFESIKKYTEEPYEIIVVDNGSSDGTVEYLESFAAKNDRVKVIVNNTNRGFAAGNNQGISIASGEYILLLNNDTILTEGWLKGLIKVFEKNPDTGIVGPVSNCVSGPQFIKEASYGSDEEMQKFALKWSEEHRDETMTYIRVVGFCLMTRREVIEKIGGLDESYGSGNFEDDDFCIRAAQAGYNARIVRDVFIHHTGSQTFKGQKINYKKSMLRNWEIFKKKWNIPPEKQLGETYSLSLPKGDISGLYIPLPDINRDHKADDKNKWWSDISNIPKEKPVNFELLEEGKNHFYGGRYREAESIFREFLKEYPENVTGLANLSCVLWQTGNTKEAEKVIKQALSLNPNDRDVVWNYGAIMTAKGRKKEALKIYKDFLEENPGDPEISQVAGELEKTLSIKHPSRTGINQKKKKKSKKKKK